MARKFRIPNKIITDTRLTFSARRLAAALHAQSNVLGAVRMNLEELAKCSGLSDRTVRRASEELEAAGYITVQQNYTYNGGAARLVYDAKEYHFTVPQSDYTLLPASILTRDIPCSAFCVYCYIVMCAGNNDRSHPSINNISHALGMAQATVCRALTALRNVVELLILRCRKKNGAYSCNSYYPGAAAVSCESARAQSTYAVIENSTAATMQRVPYLLISIIQRMMKTASSYIANGFSQFFHSFFGLKITRFIT